MGDLQQILGCYFHQDWMSDADTWEEQLENIAREEAPVRLQRALHELEDLLLRKLSEQDLVSVVSRDLSCDFYPPGAGLSYVAWLEGVRDFLRRTISQAKPL